MLKDLFTFNKAPTYSDKTINILRLIRNENVGPNSFQLIKLFGGASIVLDNIVDFSVRGEELSL